MWANRLENVLPSCEPVGWKQGKKLVENSDTSKPPRCPGTLQLTGFGVSSAWPKADLVSNQPACHLFKQELYFWSTPALWEHFLKYQMGKSNLSVVREEAICAWEVFCCSCPEFGKSSLKAKQLQAGGNYQHSLSWTCNYQQLSHPMVKSSFLNWFPYWFWHQIPNVPQAMESPHSLL